MNVRELCSMAVVGRDALALARYLVEMTWAVGMPTVLERKFPALWDASFSAAQLDFSEQPSAFPVRPLDMLVCLSHPLAARALFAVDRMTALVYDPDTCGHLAETFAVSYPVPFRRLAYECGAGDRLDAVAFGALAGLLCGPGLPARLLLAGCALHQPEQPAPALHGQLAGLSYVERHLAKGDPWQWAVTTGQDEQEDGRMAA